MTIFPDSTNCSIGRVLPLTAKGGSAAWQGKRAEPQVIPDQRIVLLNKHFDPSDELVLEMGCFEGIHTIGLAQFPRQVTAIDARIENVVKPIVRCSLLGITPCVFKCDVEREPLPIKWLSSDILHHVGVLYHLKDPVRISFESASMSGWG